MTYVPLSVPKFPEALDTPWVIKLPGLPHYVHDLSAAERALGLFLCNIEVVLACGSVGQEKSTLADDVDWLVDTSGWGRLKVRVECRKCGSTFPITVVEANVPADWVQTLGNIKCFKCDSTQFQILAIGRLK